MGYSRRALVLVTVMTVAVSWAQAQSVNFSRLRAIGDSLTINTQGGMVSDYRTQPRGWVKLLANQMGTEMRLPLLEEMSLIGQQRRQDYPDYQHCHCYAYNGVSTDDTFMKVAPEIPWYSFGWAYNHIDLVLADRPGYTMLSAMKEDDPTFVVGFLGSNDFMERVMARGTMMEGIPTLGLMETIDPLDALDMRPQEMFRSDFETVVSTLYKPGVGMCFGTLPSLPDIPGIMNKEELTAFLGTNSLPEDCYTNYTVAAGVRGGLQGPEIFGDDRNYYTPAELQTINEAILGYNTTIRQAGANPAHPFAVVETPIQDPGTTDGTIHVNGWRINNQIFTDNLGKPRTSIMTTDGVHMSDIGNALCAQRYIRAINAFYGTSIPELTDAQMTSILNNDRFADNDADGKIEGISNNVAFLTLNFVYPNDTGDSSETARNAKLLATQVFPPSSGHVGTDLEGPEFFEGTTVMVSAYPEAGTAAIFSHWEGDIPGGSSTQNPLSITMDAHKTLVAVFDAATVPDVVGLSQEAASNAITGAGLTVGTITEQFSATVATGTVLAQLPQAGAPAAYGSAVDLTVAKTITGSIVINNNRSATNNPAVSLALAWSGGMGTGVVRMRFSEDGAHWTAWESLKAVRSYTLAPGADGHRTVRVQYLDQKNNRSATFTDYIRLDTAPPTGTIVINNGALTTTSPSVTLKLTWADGAGSGVVRMRFSNDGAHWSAWEPQATPRVYTLPGPIGYNTVRVQYRDGADNYSAVFNDYIKLLAP